MSLPWVRHHLADALFTLQTRVYGRVLNRNKDVHSNVPPNWAAVDVGNDDEAKSYGNCAFEPTASFDFGQFPEELEPSSIIGNWPRMPQSQRCFDKATVQMSKILQKTTLSARNKAESAELFDIGGGHLAD